MDLAIGIGLGVVILWLWLLLREKTKEIKSLKYAVKSSVKHFKFYISTIHNTVIDEKCIDYDKIVFIRDFTEEQINTPDIPIMTLITIGINMED